MDKHRLITGTFLGVIAVITVWTLVTPQKTFSSSENRYLQKKPEFTIEGLLDGSYGKKYETYLSDQFPERDRWIGLKVLSERMAGKTAVNGVYIGKDGYLLEKFEEEEIEGDQLNSNLDKAGAFMQVAAEKLGEDKVRIMLVPSASQIMTDQLPALAAPYDQSRVTEKLLQKLKDNGFSEDQVEKLVVPVEDYLDKNKNQPFYYKTDHHWTGKGSYVGYEAWADSIGLEPWEEEYFEIKTVSENFRGTIYSKLNIPWQLDKIEIYVPREEQEYKVFFDGESKEYDTLYFTDALKGRDQYKVYLDGNHGLTEIVNQNIVNQIAVNHAAAGDEKDRKLLIIKDSYAHSFAPFAVNHFETVYMADLRYFNMKMGAFIEQEGITDVLILYQIPGFAKEKTISKLGWES